MPLIFEPPHALLAAQQAGLLGSLSDGTGVASSGGSQIWIAASPANGDGLWGGCQVWLSFDDATYGQIGTITSRANQGVLTANLASPPGANPDTTDTLGVDLSMSGGALPTGSDADAQAGRTLCYVDGELIAYGLATPTTGSAYNLTDLYRALYGSTGGSHASGAAFVLLDDNIFKYNLPSGYAGQTLYFKFASFNAFGGGVQDLASLTAVSYTPTAGVVPSGLITGGDASVSAAGVISFNSVNGNVGTFQGITVNAKGLVTAAVTESYLMGNQTVTLSGDVAGSGATAIATTLAPTGVTAGSYTLAGITVDAKGRVTAASDGSVTVPSGASPVATAGPTPVAGSAATFMRSDAAPAVQLGSASQPGIVQADGKTITAAGGIISQSVNALSTPFANPTGTTSIFPNGTMMGLGGSFVPSRTGTLLVILQFSPSNTSGATAGVVVWGYYGTGTAPANGAAATGTYVGPANINSGTYNNAGIVSGQIIGVISGLTLAATYWFDVAVAAFTLGTASITDCSLTIVEL